MPSLRVSYLLAAPFCSACDGIVIGQIHSIAWALILVLSFYLLLRQLTGSSIAAALAAVLLLVSQAIWVYSTQVEPYVPFVGALVCLTFLLVRYNERSGIRWIVAATALLAVAIFYHQAGVLFCLPLASYLIIGDRRRGWIFSLAVIGAAGVLVLTTYVMVYLAIYGEWSLTGFRTYLFRYSSVSNPLWHSIDNVSFRGIAGLIGSQLETIMVPPWELRSVMQWLFGATVAATLVWNGRQILIGNSFRPTRVALMLWLLSFWGFFLWWIPGEYEFFMLTLVPLLVLGVLAINDAVTYVGKTGFEPWSRSAPSH